MCVAFTGPYAPSRPSPTRLCGPGQTSCPSWSSASSLVKIRGLNRIRGSDPGISHVNTNSKNRGRRGWGCDFLLCQVWIFLTTSSSAKTQEQQGEAGRSHSGGLSSFVACCRHLCPRLPRILGWAQGSDPRAGLFGARARVCVCVCTCECVCVMVGRGGC